MSRLNEPAGPDPDNTPGLEPGGGVAPGDTPPAEESTTEGLSTPEIKEPSRRANAGIAIGIVAVLVVLALLLFLRPW